MPAGAMRKGRQSVYVPMADGRPRTEESVRHGEERRKRDRRKGTHQHPLIQGGTARAAGSEEAN